MQDDFISGTIKFDENGREIPNPTPVAVPFPVDRPEPIHLRVRRLVLESINSMAAGPDIETIDEANDFDCPEEDAVYRGPYDEPDFMPQVPQGFDGLSPLEKDIAYKLFQENKKNAPEAQPSAVGAQNDSRSTLAPEAREGEAENKPA